MAQLKRELAEAKQNMQQYKESMSDAVNSLQTDLDKLKKENEQLQYWKGKETKSADHFLSRSENYWEEVKRLRDALERSKQILCEMWLGGNRGGKHFAEVVNIIEDALKVGKE
jgi:phenylalanyl-tRNA synthetase alpha subunit